MMDALENRWNDQSNLFHFKINRMASEMNQLKRDTHVAYTLKTKQIPINRCSNLTNRRELINTNNNEMKDNLQKLTVYSNTNSNISNNSNVTTNNTIIRQVSGTSNVSTISNTSGNNCGNHNINTISNNKNNNKKGYTYVAKNTKTNNVAFPTSKATSNKLIKTHDTKLFDTKNNRSVSSRTKRRNGKPIKLNEKKWLIARKQTKVEKPLENEVEIEVENEVENNLEKKQSKKSKMLYLEGEEGNIQMYPLYADSEIGFDMVSNIEEETLSKVKKKNQDDDDIKTTKHLAQWSSDLVHKYLEEAIEKSKIVFHGLDINARHAEMFKRIES